MNVKILGASSLGALGLGLFLASTPLNVIGEALLLLGLAQLAKEAVDNCKSPPCLNA